MEEFKIQLNRTDVQSDKQVKVQWKNACLIEGYLAHLPAGRAFFCRKAVKQISIITLERTLFYTGIATTIYIDRVSDTGANVRCSSFFGWLNLWLVETNWKKLFFNKILFLILGATNYLWKTHQKHMYLKKQEISKEQNINRK